MLQFSENMTPHNGVILKRILLHNWYAFVSEIIPISYHTTLVGANGTGKSTILDATFYGLTGISNQFNKASGNKSVGEARNRRTLQSYVRGYTGREGEPYLRPDGLVTCYIMLEFEQESTHRKFVIVRALESASADDSSPKPTIFVFYDDEASFILEDISYLGKNGIEVRPTDLVIKNHKKNRPASYKCASNEEYKRKCQRLFGEDFRMDDFCNSFGKMLAYRRDQSVPDFLKTVLYGERPIEIQGNVEILDKLENTEESIRINEDKQKYLQPIDQLWTQYQNVDHQRKIYGFMKTYADALQCKKELEDLQAALQKDKEDLAIAEKNYQNASEDYERQRQKLDIIQDQINQTRRESGQDKYENQLKDQKQKLQFHQTALDDLQTFCSSLQIAAGNIPELKDVAEPFLSGLQNENIDHVAAYRELQTLCLGIKEKAENAQQDAEFKKRDLTKVIEQKNKELGLMSKYKTNTSENVVNFISYAKQTAKSEGRFIELFCVNDVIDDVDQEWIDAIEGILGRNGANSLVCRDADYEYVKRLMDEVPKNQKTDLYLFDSARHGNKPCMENSLGEKIHTENPYARKFLNYRLGNILIVQNRLELENQNGNRAITSSGLFYTGNGVRTFSHKTTHFLGQKAQEQYKETLIKEIRSNSVTLKKIDQTISTQRNILNRVSLCSLSHTEYLDAFVEDRQIRDSIADIESSIAEFNQDQTQIDLGIKLGAETPICKELKEKADQYNYEVKSMQRHIQMLTGTGNGSIAEKQAVLAQKKAEQDNISDEYYAEVEKLYSRRKSDIERGTINWNRCDEQIAKINDEFSRRVNDVALHYPEENRGTDPRQYKAYSERYMQLRTENSGTLQETLERYREAYKNNIKSNVISQLYENFSYTERLKNELNKALHDVRFGNDRYQLDAEPNHDEEYYTLYKAVKKVGKALTDESELPPGWGTETDQLVSKIADEIIRLAHEEDPEKREKRLQEILDYRNYFKFDICKYVGDSSQKIRLSKKLGSDSGGEAQTAYYVVLAAAFAALYSEYSLRLVMIDEAFDKIDQSRKGTMAKFLHEFGFQTIYTTPNDEDLAPFCEERLVVTTTDDKRITFTTPENLEEERKNVELFKFIRKKEQHE